MKYNPAQYCTYCGEELECDYWKCPHCGSEDLDALYPEPKPEHYSGEFPHSP